MTFAGKTLVFGNGVGLIESIPVPPPDSLLGRGYG